MIVVDSSVLVAIAREETDHHRFAALIARAGACIGSPTVVETKLVLASVLSPAASDDMFDRLARDAGLKPVAFTPEMADAAVQAFRRFGKGQGHPAQLNFGDCLAYAVAKVLDAPLLYKGNDFAQTDIRPALP